jgi:hypothetical protein
MDQILISINLKFLLLKTFESSLIMLSVLLMIISCTTAPELKRDNINDSESKNYIPDLPSSSDVSISYQENKDLVLSFSPKEKQDGVVISKSYYGDGNYVVLDTLYTDTTFTDTSKQFVEGTSYTFNFFRDIEGLDFIFNQTPYTTQVALQPINSMTVDYGGRYNNPDRELLALNLAFDNRISENARIFDGISIEINENTNGIDNWVEILEIPANEVLVGKNDLNYQINLFDLELRLTQFIYDTTGAKIIISELQKSRAINQIDDLNYTIIDEMNATLRWTNPIENATEGYIVSGSVNDTIYTKSKNTYDLRFDTPPSYPVKFNLRPFIGTNIGNSISSQQRYANISEPDFVSLLSLNEQSMELGWTSAGEHTYGYLIESKRTSDVDFTLVDSTSRDIYSYIINGLDKNIDYQFRVKSYTSDHSPIITTSYGPTLAITSQTELDQVGVSVKYSTNKKFRGKISPQQLYIKNLETGQEYYHSLPEYDYSHRPSFKNFTISESTNTVAYLSDNHSYDNAGERVTVLDFINDQIVSTTQLSFGSYEIHTLENDSLFAFSRTGYNDTGATLINPFGASTKEFSALNYLTKNGLLLKSVENSNTFLACSEADGIHKFDLTTGSFITIDSIPCFRLSYRQDEATINANTSIGFNVYDFKSGAMLTHYSQLDTSPDYVFYFKKLDVLIYRGSFFGYKLIIDGNTYDFLLPSLTENRRGSIMYITSGENNSYQITTYDSDVMVDLADGWTILSTEE